jgi:hypothetical protein
MSEGAPGGGGADSVENPQDVFRLLEDVSNACGILSVYEVL